MADLQSANDETQPASESQLATRDGLRLHTGCTDGLELSPELARLIDAWPSVPEHVRRAIMTLAEGCQ
jgi:hypothetical protein